MAQTAGTTGPEKRYATGMHIVPLLINAKLMPNVSSRTSSILKKL